MTLLTGSIFLDIFILLATIIFLIYWYISHNDYWDVRQVPNEKRGVLFDALLGRKSQVEATIDMYSRFCGEKYFGLYQVTKPVLWIRDLELIQNILVKDFSHFQNRGVPEFKNDLFSKSLFSLRGHAWRTLRNKLTPTFTTGKLKVMFNQVAQCGDNIIHKIEEVAENKYQIDPKPVLFEYALDVIASCAFGIQLSPDSVEFDQFKSSVKKLSSFSPIRAIKVGLLMTYPKLGEFFNISPTSKEVSDYFLNLTTTNIRYRKENNVVREDYFQLLLTLQEQERSGKDLGLTSPGDVSEEDAVIDQMRFVGQNSLKPQSTDYVMTDECVSAQSSIFLLAGSESIASTINYTLMELSRHKEVQRRVQQEVDSMLSRHGRWSYECLKDMTYMDQVIQETQRMHPLNPLLLRECVETFKVPGSDLVIEKGVQVTIPVAGLHMDPNNYPEPDKFKPERFEKNNFKPNPAFLPFGDGPRICIAMRFAVMEVKTCLAKILAKYSVDLSPKTKLPITYSKQTILTEVEGGIWLAFDKRNKSA